MSKVLFLDIDGVLLPGRAYNLPNQTKPIVRTFDPCAVSMLNEACGKQGRKIVVHSSWVKHMVRDQLLSHLLEQGVHHVHFHEDWVTNPTLYWRYDRIDEWLARHPECEDYFILDDEDEINHRNWGPDRRRKHTGHLILTDFDEGITVSIFHKILDGVAPRKGLDKAE